MSVLTYTREDSMTTKGLQLDRRKGMTNGDYHTFELSKLPTDILGFISCNYKLTIDQYTGCPDISHKDKYLTFMFGYEAEGGMFWTESCERSQPSTGAMAIEEFLIFLKYKRCPVEDNWQHFVATGEWDIPEGYSYEVKDTTEDISSHLISPCEKDLAPLEASMQHKLKTGYVYIKGSYLLNHFTNLTYEEKPLHNDSWYSTENVDPDAECYLMMAILDVIDHDQKGAECSFGLDFDEKGWYTYEGKYYFTGK